MARVNIRNYLRYSASKCDKCDIALTQNQRDEMLEAFTLFDKDGDGLIDVRKIGTVIRAIGQVPTLCDETDIVAQFAQENCCKSYLNI